MKTFRPIRLTIAASIVFATFSAASIADQDDARDLYFNPTKALFAGGGTNTVISTNDTVGSDFVAADNGNLGGIGGYYEKLENPGVTYTIELLRKGSNTPKQVNGNHVFKEGDRIRLHVSANGDGYMHALHKGSSGSTMLIPISTGGRVNNGQGISIPSATGWLKFDHQKGVEVVDVVFASHANAAQQGIVPNAGNASALVANVQQVALKYSNSKNLVMHETNGEKDLILVGGATSPISGAINRTNQPTQQIVQTVYEAPATYAVNTASEPVVVKIKLRHQ